MTDEPLATAARSLREASDAADRQATAERLENQAEQFERFAEDDTGIDHGKLARHEHTLREITDEEGDGPVVEHVGEALTAIKSFREGLEGV